MGGGNKTKPKHVEALDLCSVPPVYLIRTVVPLLIIAPSLFATAFPGRNIFINHTLMICALVLALYLDCLLFSHAPTQSSFRQSSSQSSSQQGFPIISSSELFTLRIQETTILSVSFSLAGIYMNCCDSVLYD